MAGTTQVSRALRIVADAGLGHGELTEVPVTGIGSGELLLRASHSSVNYKDALAATGQGKVVRRFPLIGGIDVVGQVVESADPAYLPGDQVLVTGFGLSEDHDGGYAQWVRVPSAWVVRLPEGLSPWESMALGTGGSDRGARHPPTRGQRTEPPPGPGGRDQGDRRHCQSGDWHALSPGIRAGCPDQATRRRGVPAIDRGGVRRAGADALAKPLESARWAGAADSVGGETLAWLIRTMQRTERFGAVSWSTSAECC